MQAAVGSPSVAVPPIFKKRGNKASVRKRPATPPPADDDDSSGYSSVDEDGRSVKRQKKSLAVMASSKPSADATSASVTRDLTASTFQADRSTTITSTNDATKQSNWFDETDPQQLLGKSKSKSKKPAPTSTTTNTSTDNNDRASKKYVGPVKAPANVRTITVTDFAPDVCKDYKQTGFCGFGDSCKFLHAREDYKQGWELDRDWDITKKHSKGANNNNGTTANGENDGDGDDEDAALLESIPFACVICREPYKNPIVTKCSHYFCEACALQRYRKNPTCAICGAGTNGVFNGAKQLKKLLERKKEREERKEAEAEAEVEGEGEA